MNINSKLMNNNSINNMNNNEDYVKFNEPSQDTIN